MPPSREKIIETVQEIMSQRQFQFKNFDPNMFDFKIPHGFKIFFQIVILCSTCIFLYLLIQKIFRWYVEKIKKINPVKPIQEDSKNFIPTSSIERLHAEFLNDLQNRKVITLQKWKTNSDYIVESQNPLFKELCKLYDLAVYGGEKISNTSVSHLQNRYASWKKQQ